MRTVTVEMEWTCDVCAAVETTPRGLPGGWREIRIVRFQRDSDASRLPDDEIVCHVCASSEPSCFRKLLIKLANADGGKAP